MSKQDPIIAKFENDRLRLHVALTLELEKLFKLFSYRMITKEQFIELQKEEVDRFNTDFLALESQFTKDTELTPVT